MSNFCYRFSYRFSSCFSSLALLVGLGSAPRGGLQVAFERAAERQAVPVELLMAMGWEATRWTPDAFSFWNGYGIMDLADGGREPTLDRAARLLGLPTERLVREPALNVEGVAAILAEEARRKNGGRLPPREEALAWWDAVAALARSDDPRLRSNYASGVYAIVASGAKAEVDGETLVLAPQAINSRALPPAEPPCTACDAPGLARLYPACRVNYEDLRPPESRQVDRIVIHATQGSFSGSLAWFTGCTSRASAHYLVRSSDGFVAQLVAEEDIAWHAGHLEMNRRSIGIEHEAFLAGARAWYSDAMFDASARLVARILLRYGIPADRSHVLGHSEIPGATHADPGPDWDWERYMARVEEELLRLRPSTLPSSEGASLLPCHLTGQGHGAGRHHRAILGATPPFFLSSRQRT